MHGDHLGARPIGGDRRRRRSNRRMRRIRGWRGVIDHNLDKLYIWIAIALKAIYVLDAYAKTKCAGLYVRRRPGHPPEVTGAPVVCLGELRWPIVSRSLARTYGRPFHNHDFGVLDSVYPVGTSAVDVNLDSVDGASRGDVSETQAIHCKVLAGDASVPIVVAVGPPRRSPLIAEKHVSGILPWIVAAWIIGGGSHAAVHR